MSVPFSRENDFIHIKDIFRDMDLPYLLATIHHAIEKAGYQDITLDFSECTGAFASSMVPLCAQVLAKREQNAYVHLNLPTDNKLRKLFENTNWANLIDPRRYDVASSFGLFTNHIPATVYKNSDNQFEIVNQMLDTILGAIPGVERTDFEAFEWALNEITDNVLTHAFSEIGGIVGLSLNPQKKLVHYVVADAGIGIGASLRSGSYSGINDTQALQLAIQEGVTRDKKVGQGNGLFGSFEISHHSRRIFRMLSGTAALTSHPTGDLKIERQKIPYPGTFVYGEIDFNIPGLLSDALKFNGEKHQAAYTYIDYKYQAGEDGAIDFFLQKESKSFGSRPAGTPIRNKLNVLCTVPEYKKIKIDFDGVPIISSSFADEAFAKLLKEIGPLAFMQKIEFVNASKVCQDLLNRAITQRMKAD